MAMLTAEEGEGWQQIGDNLAPHRLDQPSLIEELFNSHVDIKVAPSGPSAGEPDFFSRLFGEGNAKSVLQSPDGTDFQLFDGTTLNASGADLSSSSMLPGSDSLGSAGGALDSINGAIGEMAGAGMPMVFFSQLFQFLMNLFTQSVSELSGQLNQSAAAAAAEVTKKMKI